MDYKIESNHITLEDQNGKLLAKIEFPCVSEDRVDISHTFVCESLKGRGIASELVAMAADKLRKENKKAVVTCSYAKKWFSQHPEHSDLIV